MRAELTQRLELVLRYAQGRLAAAMDEKDPAKRRKHLADLRSAIARAGSIARDIQP